jgi:hypothetical protein
MTKFPKPDVPNYIATIYPLVTFTKTQNVMWQQQASQKVSFLLSV